MTFLNFIQPHLVRCTLVTTVFVLLLCVFNTSYNKKTTKKTAVATTPWDPSAPRLSRTALLWQLSSVEQMEQALTQNQPGLRRSSSTKFINGTICMYYRNRQGFGNQVYNHVMAIVIAALLGVDTMQMPEAYTRESNGDKRPRWNKIDVRSLLDIDHYTIQMKRIGIDVIDTCNKVSEQNTFYIFSPNATRPRNFTYLEREFEDFLSQRPDQRIAVTSSDRYYDGTLWTALFDPGTEPKKYRDQLNAYWPSNMFRAAYSMLRFPGHKHLPEVSYGVFHLRAERDNIWMHPVEQIGCFQRFRKKYRQHEWYVASGRMQPSTMPRHSKFAGMDGILDYAIHGMRPFHTAETLDASVKGLPVEVRAGMDYNISIESDVFYGVVGPSFESVVLQMKLAHNKLLEDVTIYWSRCGAPNQDYFMDFTKLIKIYPADFLARHKVTPYDGGQQPKFPKFL